MRFHMGRETEPDEKNRLDSADRNGLGGTRRSAMVTSGPDELPYRGES